MPTLNKSKRNNSFFGFLSLSDFTSTLLGLKSKFSVGLCSLIGAITSFITGYIYHDAKAVYFMVFLLLMDALTAVVRAIRTKSFTSKRLPRVLLVMVSYCLMLAVSWNAAKYSPLFVFLPGAVYTGFIAVLITSIAENLMLAKLIPSSIYFELKEKLNPKNFFNKKDEKNNGK